MEQSVKNALGDLVFANLQLMNQVEELKKQVHQLEQEKVKRETNDD